MRQVFNAIPYILPGEDSSVANIFARFGKLKKISRGHVLKDGGDENRLYLLKSGLCMYMINYTLEKPRSLALILPGRVMGDITCISGEVVNVTTVALRNSEILTVPPETLATEMKKNFGLCIKAIKSVIAKQECHLEGMIANFTLPHEKRLATFYKALFTSYGCLAKENWNKIPLKLSNEELGNIVHATRVTVNRIHLKWKAAGLYRREGANAELHSNVFKNLYDWRNSFLKEYAVKTF